MRLHNKTAIITGGGTGIGKAIALAFAKEGAHVAICGRHIEPLEEVLSEIPDTTEYAMACVVDVTSLTDIKKFIDDVLARFGTIDILVNNAGIAVSGSVVTQTPEEWDKVLCVDLKGMYLLSHVVLPYFLSQEEGKIINMASIAGLVGFANNAAYAAAKGAVISLTRQMALDVAAKNINVNAIAPGFIATDMTKDYLKSEQAKKAVIQKTPLGKIGTPEDIATVALFLASDESRFITGQTLVVDGGWTLA